MTGVEMAQGYIKWFYSFSHPRILLQDEDVPIPRPPEQEALDKVVAEQNGEDGYLVLTKRLDHIRDHRHGNGVVQQGTDEWCHLEGILAKVNGGRVYRRRCTRGGGGKA